MYAKPVFCSIMFAPASCTLLVAQELVSNRQRDIVFKSVNVIPMDRERVIENQTVVVQNGQITAMGK